MYPLPNTFYWTFFFPLVIDSMHASFAKHTVLFLTKKNTLCIINIFWGQILIFYLWKTRRYKEVRPERAHKRGPIIISQFWGPDIAIKPNNLFYKRPITNELQQMRFALIRCILHETIIDCHRLDQKK